MRASTLPSQIETRPSLVSVDDSFAQSVCKESPAWIGGILLAGLTGWSCWSGLTYGVSVTGLSTLRTTGLGCCAKPAVVSSAISRQAGKPRARVYLNVFVETLPRTRERATSAPDTQSRFAKPGEIRSRRAVFTNGMR